MKKSLLDKIRARLKTLGMSARDVAVTLGFLDGATLEALTNYARVIGAAV